MASERATGEQQRLHGRRRGDRRQRASPAHERTLQRLTGGGTAGNERLTALTGAILIVGLAVLGVTIVRNRQLLWLHLFLGMALLAPVALKMASTGYRFARYYTGKPAYRRKGPPPAALRLLAPVLVLSTVCVFASGVALLVAGPSSRGTLVPVHRVSFFVWLAVTAVHVLAHLGDTARALNLGTARRVALGSAGKPSVPLGRQLAGRTGRAVSLAAAVVGGVVLAAATIPLFTPWLNDRHELRLHPQPGAAQVQPAQAVTISPHSPRTRDAG